jgi:hypothetical protein
VVTVEVDPDSVERRLAAGGLRCPGCSGVLHGWGYARPRMVRGVVGAARVRPRRARCSTASGCGRTHVLLPVTCLVRRADDVEVIGSALAKAADGWGHRRIAEDLGRFPETVRGWLRRLVGRAEAVRVFFTVLAVRVAVEVVLPEPAGSVLGDAVAAIKAAAGSVASRFEVGAVTAWQVACAVSAGGLLAPGWPPSRTELINTSSP